MTGSGDNTDRILRVLARFLGVGYLAYLAILIPTIRSYASDIAAWWTPMTVVLVFGTGMLPGILSLRGSATAVRRAAAVAASTYLAAVASWWLLWDGQQVSGDAGVYLAEFPGLAGVTAALAWPVPAAFTYLAVAVFGAEAITVVGGQESPSGSLLPAFAFSLTFTALFVGGAGMALRTGRVLDETREQTEAAAAAAAARRARSEERERFGALIHDSVISTFLVATSGRNPDVAADAAEAALTALDDLRGTPRAGQALPAGEVVDTLRVTARDLDPGIGITVVGGACGTVPAEVVRSLGAATTEALRNSVRHAGPHARRTVTLTVTDPEIRVEVRDTGCGFTRSEVAPHRLGIAVSILGRMDNLPGGSARVDSTPGDGTTVQMVWMRQ
ncbi:sensor histidine kinase [Rhodococcus sp. NPDC003318]|uniref:sensor histidine kinase n=1 Tax=Rhodococcus sp. NPDC003318 TaxID=3364503 RepID=UPI003690F840